MQIWQSYELWARYLPGLILSQKSIATMQVLLHPNEDFTTCFVPQFGGTRRDPSKNCIKQKIFIYSVKLILILFILFYLWPIFSNKRGGKLADFLSFFLRKKVVNFEHQLREIDSMYPLLSPRHVLEDSLSFPTVCGMLMVIFLRKTW